MLEDIHDATSFALHTVSGKSLHEFQSNRLLRSAVERNFEIIGKAIKRLTKCDPETAAKIGAYVQIIAFRNILAHGYDVVDQEIIWSSIRNKLSLLNRDIEKSLGDVKQKT